MCRLFGMSGGGHRVHASFWLLDAPDSLAAQSHQQPDGYGIGTFEADGTPDVDKRPIPAFEDAEFLRDALDEESRVFIAHLRAATTGGGALKNTHPFEMRGRLLAHNGVIGDLPALEEHLGDHISLVGGDTDSERFFALITRETEAAGGDVTAGLTAAARWVAENLQMYSLNVVVVSATDLWALRYPETNELYTLACEAYPTSRELEGASARGTMHVSSPELAQGPAVVVASERMDDSAGWRLLEPGELLHVGPELSVESTIAVDRPPAHMMSLSTETAAAQA